MIFIITSSIYNATKLFNIADYGHCDVRTYGKALGISDELCNWLDERPHSLMIRYGSDKRPNDHYWVELDLPRETDALLFKLTWA